MGREHAQHVRAARKRTTANHTKERAGSARALSIREAASPRSARQPEAGWPRHRRAAWTTIRPLGGRGSLEAGRRTWRGPLRGSRVALRARRRLSRLPEAAPAGLGLGLGPRPAAGPAR